MSTPLGKYKLVKLIAAGGMAEVYLAKQAGAAGFEKQVCLKRILPHLARDKQFVEMFLNEARLASQLDHPNIVSIFDLGEANGNYFIAMEFIDGPNLRSVAKRAKEVNELLPIPEVLKIVAQAAAGLEYAHDLTDREGNPLGLVHRDISPDNILVHRNGTAKVVDFGIAKAANSAGHTRTGTLKGKVAYMPPEQLRGEPLDRRTDVWALGVVLYELLGGKRPWDASNEVALIGAIMTTEPQPLNELRDDAPAELVRIVHQALVKERDQRYQSCAELQHDLEQLVVTMGQSITNARIADFVKAYSAPPDPSASEGTGAEMGAIEAETFGTGAVAPIVGQPGTPAGPGSETPAGTDAGTLMMPGGPAAPQPKSRALVYGLAAFGAIAVLAGGGAAVILKGGQSDEQQPVAVERATAPKAPAPPAPPPPPPVEPPKEVVQAPPPVEAPKPAEPARPRVVARADPKPAAPAAPAEPQAPAVVIQREAPPPPSVTAKGELVLMVRPWAKVEIDGREMGVTPLPDAIKLAPGEHKVRLMNSELEKDITRTVTIEAGQRAVLKEILDGE